MILLNLLVLVAVLCIPSNVLCRPSSCLWVKTILPLPFQFLYLLFLLLALLHCLVVPVQCWIEVVGSHCCLTLIYLFIYLSIYLFIYGCVGSSLLCWVFVAAHGLCCGAWASHCGGFSLLQSMGSRHAGFSSCGSRALECRLSSCGAQA